MMDVILHLGVHRTAAASFHAYLRDHKDVLSGHGLGIWGPERTQTGLFRGLSDKRFMARNQQRAGGRLKIALARAAGSDLSALLISDPGLLGAPHKNLSASLLYPDAGLRMARLGDAMGNPRRVVLQIRSPETYWASLIAAAVQRGASPPDTVAVARLAACHRSWRDVINDLACALPRSELRVTCFERLCSQPGQLLQAATGLLLAPVSGLCEWLNPAPDLALIARRLKQQGRDARVLPQVSGRWQPFSQDQSRRMLQTYANDLAWLRAGSDGVARFYEEPELGPASPWGDPDQMTRGQNHDVKDRTVANTG